MQSVVHRCEPRTAAAPICVRILASPAAAFPSHSRFHLNRVSRYEYELFSGRVAAATSESLVSGEPIGWGACDSSCAHQGSAGQQTLVPAWCRRLHADRSQPHRRHARFTTAFTNGRVHLADANWLLAAARRVGLLRRPAVGAVHTLLVETPTGQQRTFRWAAAGSCWGHVLLR